MKIFKERRRNKAARLAARGQTQKAAEIYRSLQAWPDLVDLYVSRKQIDNAVQAAVLGEDFTRAAQLRAEQEQHDRAADLWLRAGDKHAAAMAYERAGNFERAADVYIDLGMKPRAAAALSLIERHTDAARLLEESGERKAAIESYLAANLPLEAARMLADQGKYEAAAELQRSAGKVNVAAELFEKAGNLPEAANCRIKLNEYCVAGELFERAHYPIEAADAYDRDDDCLEQAARLYRHAMRPAVGWRRELNAGPLCLAVAPNGTGIALGTSARGVILLDPEGGHEWRFKPNWGGFPRAIVTTPTGEVAVGCDDAHLYYLDREKTLHWTLRLPGEATCLAMAPDADRIVCGTKGNDIVCVDTKGTQHWEYHSRAIIWDIALSGDGKVVAAGTADGTCLLLDAQGKRSGRYTSGDWVHSVSLSQDGAFCAMGVGMSGVRLVRTDTLDEIWAATDPSPVHRVILSPSGNVLSIGDDEAVLRDGEGAVRWRYRAQQRIMGGDMVASERWVALRCVGNKVVRVDLHPCAEQAAQKFEQASMPAAAAEMYEAMGDHARAASLYQEVDDALAAARNLERVGKAAEASRLFENAGDLAAAARAYKATGNLRKAAACLIKADDPAGAGELLQQLGETAAAAEQFERAGEPTRAATLYRTAGKLERARDVLVGYLEDNPDDAERRLDLGILFQELDQLDDAIAQFQRVEANESLRRAARLGAAECFLAKDMYDVAIHRYETCMAPDEEMQRDNLEVFYGLAKAYELAGRYEQAKHLYERIVAIEYHYEDVRERLDNVNTLAIALGSQTTTVASSDGLAPTVIDQQYQRLSAAAKDRYAIKRQLGKGGMGTVYLAEDRRLRRTVALKVISPEMASDEQIRLRMVREAQAVAQLNHQNVVGVFDVGEDAGRSYISMEYVDGSALSDLLAQKGRMAPAECVPILRQVAAGLGCAHAKGILHRDVKPANVMVEKTGVAKVMDFGLAIIGGATRMTTPGLVSGTWNYMAPEQARGEVDLTCAVDIYSMGCMAYELLAGRPPFTGTGVAGQHQTRAPEPISDLCEDLPDGLADIVMTCLEKSPEDRFPDGNTLEHVLRKVEGQL